MKCVYPITISKGEKYYIVYVPDLNINTQGVDVADAISMARDAIAMWACAEQDAKREIPSPSNIIDIPRESDDIVTLVDVDIDLYRRKLENRTIRKNLTIPSWLNEIAEENKINFSETLKKALMQELNILE